jgi:uncharacterized membrane protein
MVEREWVFLQQQQVQLRLQEEARVSLLSLLALPLLMLALPLLMMALLLLMMAFPLSLLALSLSLLGVAVLLVERLLLLLAEKFLVLLVGWFLLLLVVGRFLLPSVLAVLRLRLEIFRGRLLIRLPQVQVVRRLSADLVLQGVHRTWRQHLLGQHCRPCSLH